MKLPAVVREINWFAAVGVAATAINYVGALAAHAALRLDTTTADIAGYAAAVGVSYFGNSLLTFRRPALNALQLARFAAISLAGLAVNVGTLRLVQSVLGWPQWSAMIPVVIVVPAATFVMSKFWAFKEMEAAG